MRIFAACLLITLAAGVSAFGQLSPSADWAVHAANQYQVFPNLTYLTASNYEAKLDIYKRRDTTGPQPTIRPRPHPVGGCDRGLIVGAGGCGGRTWGSRDGGLACGRGKSVACESIAPKRGG